LDHINACENKSHEIEKNCNSEKNHKDKSYFMIVVDPLIQSTIPVPADKAVEFQKALIVFASFLVISIRGHSPVFFLQVIPYQNITCAIL